MNFLNVTLRFDYSFLRIKFDSFSSAVKLFLIIGLDNMILLSLFVFFKKSLKGVWYLYQCCIKLRTNSNLIYTSVVY